MEAQESLFFNVLVNRYHAQDAATFLSTLPQNTLQSLKDHPTSSSDTIAGLRLPDQTFTHMHYSWLVPVLRQEKKFLQPLLVACLSDKQQQGICRQLQIPTPKPKLSKVVQRYLLRYLTTQMGITQIIPRAYLPANPLTPLASLSREQLILLIDYLGLRDLAEALRPIVDNRLLQAIHRCLKPAELQLVRAYLHQRDTLKVAKLNFSTWDGQRDSLRLMYHQRGLARLAKALAGQSPDLLWHISRHLDQKRAKFLESLTEAKDSTAVTQTLILHVVAILDFLQRPPHEQ
jgi:hypothetical protein